MVYMVPESKWPKDPATRKQWRQAREKARIEYYEDEARHELLGDEKFTKGAELARFLEADNDVLACAAGLLREKQAAYKRMSAVGRFFSYLNPFYDEYREERKAISKLKQKVVAATKCDKKKLDDYVNGKTDEIYTEDKETLPYNSLHNFLIQANRYQIFGDPFADKINNAPQTNAEPQNDQPSTGSARGNDQPVADETAPNI